MRKWANWFRKKFIFGESIDEDKRRQEYVLKVILCSIFFISLAALVASYFIQQLNNIYLWNTIHICILTSSLTLAAWLIAASGRHNTSGFLLVTALFVVAVQISLSWSFELASVQLLTALILVIAGFIFKTRLLLIISFSLILATFCIGQMEIEQGLEPDMSVTNKSLETSDNLNYNLILGLFITMSLLANSEIRRSLQQSKLAKEELAKERDLLELKVIERTRMLERSQRARTTELQRFAEFGRLSAHMLHDLANPVTAASLHMELIQGKTSPAYQQARQNISQIEKYIATARKQLQSESSEVLFDTIEELDGLLCMLRPLAERSGVKIFFEQSQPISIHSDPVKFHRVMSNLIVNAIEACSGTTNNSRAGKIRITMNQSGQYISISITDNGPGVHRKNIDKLFDPFFSTKHPTKGSLGLGLAMVKQTVEVEFGGKLSVSSSLRCGTTFTIVLPTRPKIMKQVSANGLVSHQTFNTKSHGSQKKIRFIENTEAIPS